MNIFIRELAGTQIDEKPDLASSKLVVEDNIGESIHIHWRNFRIEMSIQDFQTFSQNITKAKEEIENGDY